MKRKRLISGIISGLLTFSMFAGITLNTVNANAPPTGYIPQTKTVTFSESTSQNGSQTVTIPYLANVKSVTVNTGNVSYTRSGNNLTINVSGGTPSRSYTPSTTVSSTSDQYANSSFPSTKWYDDGTYRGNIGLSGSPWVVSGSGPDSYWRTDYRQSWGNDLPGSLWYNDGTYSGYLYGQGVWTSTEQTGGSYTPRQELEDASGEFYWWSNDGIGNFWSGAYGTSPSRFPSDYLGYGSGTPSDYPYNWENVTTYWTADTYTMPKGSVDYSHIFWDYRHGVYMRRAYVRIHHFRPAVDTRTWGTMWKQNYGGTVYRPDTRTWRQNYNGVVYANTINYYTYNVTVTYEADPNATLTLTKGTTSATNIGLSWTLNDVTSQSYKYYLYRNGTLIASDLTVSSYNDTDVSDVTKPTNPSVTLTRQGSKVTANISSTDNGTPYSYYVVGYGQTLGNTVTSNTVSHTISSSIKQYNYKFSTNPNLNVDLSASNGYIFNDTLPTMTGTTNGVSLKSVNGNNVLAFNNSHIQSSSYNTNINLKNSVVENLEFDVYVSSETNYDWLSVVFDGDTKLKASGIAGTSSFNFSGGAYATNTADGEKWVHVVIPNISVTSGSHALYFSYLKDASVDKGIDNAYIDNIRYTVCDTSTTSSSFSNILNDNTTYYLYTESVDTNNNISNIVKTTVNIPAITPTITATGDNVNNKVNLSWSVNDTTQSYLYDIYRDGTLILNDVSSTSYSDTIAKDISAPNQVSNVNVVRQGSKVTVTFSGTDNGSSYTYYVVAKGQSDVKNRNSQNSIATVLSNIKNYSYGLTQDSTATLPIGVTIPGYDNTYGYNFDGGTIPSTFTQSPSNSISISNTHGSNAIQFNNSRVDNSANSFSIPFNATKVGDISFSSYISSELNVDNLTVTLDGVQMLQESGCYDRTYFYFSNGTYSNDYSDEQGAVTGDVWLNMVIPNVPMGNHTLTFKYTKDYSAYDGDDNAYIDNIKLPITTSSNSNPIITPVVITSTAFSQVLNDNSTYYLLLRATDNSGINSSDIKTTIIIPNIVPTITATGDSVNSKVNLSWSVNDNTQTYLYDVYRDGTKILSDVNYTSYTDTNVKDTTKPTAPSTVNISQVMDYTLDYNKVNFSITAPTDNGTTFKYYVVAKGQVDGKNRTSATDSATITSGIKGYAYTIDNNSTATLNTSTINTSSTSFTVDKLPEGNLYLHIISIDNNNNYSTTYNKLFTVSELMQIKNFKLTNHIDKPTTLTLPYSFPAGTPAPMKVGYNLTFSVDTTNVDKLKVEYFINGTKVYVNNQANTDTIITTGNRNLTTKTFTIYFDRGIPRNSIIDIKFTGTKYRADGTSKDFVENIIGYNSLKVVGSSIEEVLTNYTN